jgi:hypothetical protein
VITGPDASSEYAITIARPDAKQPQETVLGAESISQQEAALDIPDELTGPLERFVARNGLEAGYTLETANAVVAALQSEHAYALNFSPNPGDALSSFLDSPGEDAHCAYFASATVMILRHLGYPARLVSGFFAHEPAGGGITVRGRDAHAWAEVHVPQKGWVLIEATPATGLPSGDAESVSWFSRQWEKITDAIRALRAELESGNLTFIAVPAGFVAIILGISFYVKRKRKTSLDVTDKRFSDFVREYNGLCRKLGIPNVGNETLVHHFNEHVTDMDEAIRDEVRACILLYEQCRYGSAALEANIIDNLRALRKRTSKH